METARSRRSLTAREAAARVGRSERTIRRWVAVPRDEYESAAANRRREAVRLADEGLSSAQVAERMGITAAAVRSLWRTARQHGEGPQRTT